MSAVAPFPEPPDEPAPVETGGPTTDADGWTLLETLRRRQEDQTVAVRKTQTQMTELAHSIAALVEEQRRRTRRVNLNSFVAYAIFTLLVGGAAYFLYQSRASELGAARDHAAAALVDVTHRADDATQRLAARDKADAAAWDVYTLLEAGKHAEAKTRLDALRDAPLSKTERAVLTATAHETQVMAVEAAMKAAIASFKAGHYADVIAPLETALAGEGPGMRAAQMHYYLGVAYAKGNDLDKAQTHLGAAVAADVDQEDARFQLASVLDRAGLFPRARAEYDRFATAHPQSPLSVYAMRRSATLARMPALPPVVVAPPKAAVVAPVPKPVVIAPPLKPPAIVPPAKPPAPAPAPAPTPPADDPSTP